MQRITSSCVPRLAALAVAIMIGRAGSARGDIHPHADEPLQTRIAAAAPGPPTPVAEGANEGDLVMDEQLAAAVEQEVAKRLAGIPRPVYIPATDILPPKGLVLYASKKKDGGFPYALAIDGFVQFRWLELSRSVADWTDSVGVVRPVNNENAFNLNRFLIGLSGYVGSEQVPYNISLFGTTNAGIAVTAVPVGFVGWRVTEDATIGGGVTQVPGTREWMISSRWPMGVDRSMANTYFRPSYSPGFMAIGSFLEKRGFYHAGIYNGIDGGASGLFREGTSMAFSGNTWFEPLGPYGLGYSDMEHHDELAVRIGTSGTYARTPAKLIEGFAGYSNPENTVVRLSDGTPIAEPGALGPNSRLRQFRYNLATVDAGFKYRGWSGFFEYSWRYLNNFVGEGQFVRQSLFDQGGSAFLGWAFVPRTYEVYGRTSALNGQYGTAQEYGGGLNWYLHETRQNRLTVEGLYINSSPTLNYIYPYRAGFTGMAIQTQYLVVF